VVDLAVALFEPYAAGHTEIALAGADTPNGGRREPDAFRSRLGALACSNPQAVPEIVVRYQQRSLGDYPAYGRENRNHRRFGKSILIAKCAIISCIMFPSSPAYG